MFTLVKCRQFTEIAVCKMLMLLFSLLLLLCFSCTWAYLVTAWQQPAQVNAWGGGPYIQYSNCQPPGTWTCFCQTLLLCLRKTLLSWSRQIWLVSTDWNLTAASCSVLITRWYCIGWSRNRHSHVARWYWIQMEGWEVARRRNCKSSQLGRLAVASYCLTSSWEYLTPTCPRILSHTSISITCNKTTLWAFFWVMSLWLPAQHRLRVAQ